MLWTTTLAELINFPSFSTANNFLRFEKLSCLIMEVKLNAVWWKSFMSTRLINILTLPAHWFRPAIYKPCKKTLFTDWSLEKQKDLTDRALSAQLTVNKSERAIPCLRLNIGQIKVANVDFPEMITSLLLGPMRSKLQCRSGVDKTRNMEHSGTSQNIE